MVHFRLDNDGLGTSFAFPFDKKKRKKKTTEKNLFSIFCQELTVTVSWCGEALRDREF